MKIRLVLFSPDQAYMEHLVNYLSIHHTDTLELNIFDEAQAMEEYLKDYRADLILLDSALPVRPQKGEILIRLTEEPEESLGERFIFKYQKGELIYKALLDAFASGTDRSLYRRSGEGGKEMTLHLFLPVNGGAGASTAARAYAAKCASGQRTLYLNLELFGNCEKTLKAEGQFSFDDILYALKNKRGSLSLKLESAVKQSQEGVFFYAPSENPVNLMDFTEQEFHQLMEEHRKSGGYDQVILDMDSFPSPWMQGALKDADQIWLVADGSDASAEKYGRLREFIAVLERKQRVEILSKMRLFYNKYSSRTGKPVEGCELKVAGGSPRYENADARSIIRKMAESNAFEQGGM